MRRPPAPLRRTGTVRSARLYAGAGEIAWLCCYLEADAPFVAAAEDGRLDTPISAGRGGRAETFWRRAAWRTPTAHRVPVLVGLRLAPTDVAACHLP